MGQPFRACSPADLRAPGRRERRNKGRKPKRWYTRLAHAAWLRRARTFRTRTTIGGPTRSVRSEQASHALVTVTIDRLQTRRPRRQCGV